LLSLSKKREAEVAEENPCQVKKMEKKRERERERERNGEKIIINHGH